MEQNIPGFGPLAEGAKSTHDLFMSFVDAGFKREEALMLVGGMLASMVRQQK